MPENQNASKEESEGVKSEASIVIKQTGSVEAAMRYLDIICPSNRDVNNQDDHVNQKWELVNRGELTNQEFGRSLDESLLSDAAGATKVAKALTDPKFIWPENVRPLVTELAAANMEIASAMREFVRSGGYTVASQQNMPWPDWPGKDTIQRKKDKASAIRSALRLPPRNEGCTNGQRALTTDQIKALQQN